MPNAFNSLSLSVVEKLKCGNIVDSWRERSGVFLQAVQSKYFETTPNKTKKWRAGKIWDNRENDIDLGKLACSLFINIFLKLRKYFSQGLCGEITYWVKTANKYYDSEAMGLYLGNLACSLWRMFHIIYLQLATKFPLDFMYVLFKGRIYNI